MVKVFTTNKNGKIEFTKEELESILNEVWNDGYNHHTYWWTPALPYYSINTSSNKDFVTITCCDENN